MENRHSVCQYTVLTKNKKPPIFCRKEDKMSATTSINLRISNEEKALIDQAAQSMGKSRTAFILENTLRVAEKVVLDRTRFTLDSRQWEELNAVLDRELSENEMQCLRELFNLKTPWQTK